jgi:hypothetical protein
MYRSPLNNKKMKTYKQGISGTTEAYQAIHDFFDYSHFHSTLEEIDKLFKWACKKKYYCKTAPANIIFLAQQLHQYFTAVEIIYYSAGKRASAILPHPIIEKAVPIEFTSNRLRSTEWECHPRHLSMEEYINPYWTFEKFVRLHNWEEMLEELMEAALSNGSIENGYTAGDLLKWRKRMMKVVEGGWLVEVRSQKIPPIE